jgi:hypothetical protein
MTLVMLPVMSGSRRRCGLAEIFVDGSAAEGQVLGWDAGSALCLDELCRMFLASSPADAVVRTMVLTMGAYLGERAA